MLLPGWNFFLLTSGAPGTVTQGWGLLGAMGVPRGAVRLRVRSSRSARPPGKLSPNASNFSPRPPKRNSPPSSSQLRRRSFSRSPRAPRRVLRVGVMWGCWRSN